HPETSGHLRLGDRPAHRTGGVDGRAVPAAGRDPRVVEASREALRKEESMRCRVKRIHDAVPVPAYATEGAAGLDLCAAAPCIIQPGQIVRVPTGVCVEIPPGYEGQVRPRSGLASQGVVAILGTIDSDYR